MKRYILLFAGLFINAFGVSFITKAALGTSPISSIPFTLSLQFPISMGTTMLVFNLFLIALQVLLLRKKFPLQYLLELPVSYLFSFFIDLTMNMLSNMNFTEYWLMLGGLLVGCCILAFGVAIEFVANVVMLPGEAFVNAVCISFNKDMGKTKVIFDSSMAVISVILCFIFFGELLSVREGTIISAILVGTIARFIKGKLDFVNKYIVAN